jgi:chromosome segregation ATPase
LLVKLGVNSVPEAISELESLFVSLQELGSKVKVERSHNRKLAKFHGELEAEFRQKEEEIQALFSKQQEQIQSLEHSNSALTRNIEESRSEVDALKTQCESLTTSHADAFGRQSREHETFLGRIKAESEQGKVQSSALILSQKEELVTLQSNLDAATAELAQYKKAVRSLKRSAAEKEQRIQEVLQQEADQERANTEQFLQEKRKQQENYERVIGHMKSKSEKMRQFIDRTSSALVECEAKVNELATINNQLSIEKSQIAARLDAASEEMRRERQLTDTRVKAAELQLKMQIEATMEDQRMNLELEKREAFSLIANAFRQYFDARNPLEGHYVQSMLEKVTADFQRLSAQDASLRKILGIGPGESLEDSVTKIVLSAYHP